MSRIDRIFRGLVLALLTAVLVTGLAVHFRGQPSRAPVEILLPAATATPSEMLVYVSGAVALEGTFPLKTGARVADAIAAAGGMSSNADRRQVNLAASAMDGQHIHVPSLNEAPPSPPGTVLLNINTARMADLEQLPGIGPVLGQAILDYREENGAFVRIEDLLNVPGIGEGLLAKIRARVTV